MVKEHTTVWVLSSVGGMVDNGLLGGLSTEQGFYLYGQVNKTELHLSCDRPFAAYQW